MKLSVKLTLAMGSLALIIALSNIFSIWQLSKVNDTTTQLADYWMPAIVAVEEMNTLLSDYRVAESQHVFATTEADKNSFEQRMEVAAKGFRERQATYETFTLVPEEKRLYDEFLKANAEYERVHKEIAGFSRQNKTADAVALLNGASRETYLRMSSLILQIVKTNVEGGRKASEEGDAIYSTASRSLTGILVASLIISIAVLVLIVRGTLAQLGKDPGVLGHIAQRVTDGDYDIDDGSPRKGVYGNIVGMVEALKRNIDAATAASEQAAQESARALDAMKSAEAASTEAKSKTEAMLVAADKLEEVANVVSSASAELAAQIEQSERGSAEQAARVGETATAMEEMNSTVLEVARNAGQASEVSASTRNKAEAGAGVVQKAVESIQEVQRQSLLLKDDMAALGENAQSINQIMGVISDIADQTNLLALNAAIEAARAGEAGRGFAVVADEVRKLAEKTMASTTDVGNAIKAIQTSADKSMTQVDSAVKTIEQATEYANQSGVALSEIVSMVDSTADQVRAIATASEQQSASSEEINQSITQVNTIAAETARAMQEAAQAVSDLANQAAVLTELIEDMKKG